MTRDTCPALPNYQGYGIMAEEKRAEIGNGVNSPLPQEGDVWEVVIASEVTRIFLQP